MCVAAFAPVSSLQQLLPVVTTVCVVRPLDASQAGGARCLSLFESKKHFHTLNLGGRVASTCLGAGFFHI